MCFDLLNCFKYGVGLHSCSTVVLVVIVPLGLLALACCRCSVQFLASLRFLVVGWGMEDTAEHVVYLVELLLLIGMLYR